MRIINVADNLILIALINVAFRTELVDFWSLVAFSHRQRLLQPATAQPNLYLHVRGPTVSCFLCAIELA